MKWPASLNPMRWPFAFKVPLLVMVLMFAVSVLVTKQVLNRLESVQKHNLQQLTSAYLDGLSTALQPSVLREDVWESFDTLDRSRSQYSSLNVKWTIVLDADGKVLAASDPNMFPTQSLPPASLAAFATSDNLHIDTEIAAAEFSRKLTSHGKPIGQIIAQADITSLLAERREILWTLTLTNVALTLVLAIIGFALVRLMTQPVAILIRHFEQGRSGELKPVVSDLMNRQSAEFKNLFFGFNALVNAVNERETLAAQLAEEEKVASLGRLASGMAHEINNPLGGMFNALDSLKRHGDRELVRKTSHRLLEQGLIRIRELVGSSLATYKVDKPLRDLTLADLDDLRLLIKPEAKLRGLNLKWSVDFSQPLSVRAVPIRDATLNLLLNACHVSSEGGTVSLKVSHVESMLNIDVADSGPGLPENIHEYVNRPLAGAAPLDRRSGLGLWLVKRLCDENHGRLHVLHTGMDGTTLRLSFLTHDGNSSQAA